MIIKESAFAAVREPTSEGPVPDWRSADLGHFVQFYESDRFLVQMLETFVKTGLENGESVIVLATRSHLDALESELKGAGRSEKGYWQLEAGQILRQLIVDGEVDRGAFTTIVETLIDQARANGRTVRVFGELVALLVDEGNTAAALELERMWEGLRQKKPFSLFCAYPIRQFNSWDKADRFRQICEHHDLVLPSEDYAAQPDMDARLRTVARLQQQAHSLDDEVTQKKQAQARFEASEARFRQLIELLPNAVYTCDLEGRITYYNRRAADLWGQAPEIGSDELRFCGSYRLRHPDGTPLPHGETPMARALRDGISTRDEEVVLERRDGSNVTVSVNIDPIRDEQGKICGAINVFQDITRRKQAELELRRKKRELTAFVENASLGLHWVGEDGIIKWANQAELEMLGYNQSEYIGHHIREFHADQPVIEDVLGRLARGEKICGCEARMKCKDGSIKTVAIDSSVFFDDGRFIHTQCFTRDISEQRRAEELSARLAAIVQSTEDAILSLDLEGRVTSWNKGAERLYGYPAEEMLEEPIEKVIPADRRNEDQRIMERIRQGERIDHYETMRVRKDGSLVDVSLTVSAVRDNKGELIGASKIARDITEKKRSESRQRALYELVASVNRAETLEDIFETALESICRCQETERAAILLIDPDGVMRFKAWRGLSDEYRAAVEGHSPWLAGDQDPQPVLVLDAGAVDLGEGLKQVIAREGIRALAFIPIRSEKQLLGKFMLYYSEARQFRDQEVLSAQTIASQLAFAIERQKTGEQLEGLVRQRTASLQEAIAQMEEFSYTVSHDLRAPLRGMQAYTEALEEDFSENLPETARRYLKRINENAGRLDRMILDVLTFSRLARSELKAEPVDLNQLVRRIIEQYPGMQEPVADIRVEPLPVICGHEPSLTQAISNLLTNAVKFVAPGVKPTVRIRAEQRQDRVRVWFEDNGIGIDPKVHHRLFKMFERAHPKLPYDGTGVGLAIVRKAMERIGGSAGVESDGLHGSRFWIEAKGPGPNCQEQSTR